MKAVCLIGMTGGVYGKAGGIINAVTSTLTELGLSSTQIKLLDYYLPYYEEGMSPEGFVKLASAMRDVKNIITAYNVTQSQPSSVMKVFLEYLETNENRRIFEDKNILNIAISQTEGEREAAGFVSALLEKCGAFELTRICIGGDTLNKLTNGSLPMDVVEKYAEDYYRLVRQNRVFLRSSAYKGGEASADTFSNLMNQVETSVRNTRQSTSGNPYDFGGALPREQTFAEPQERLAERIPDKMDRTPDRTADKQSSGGYGAGFEDSAESKKSGIDFDAFNSRQQEDIEELTKLFATRLKNDTPDMRQETPSYGFGYDGAPAPGRRREDNRASERQQGYKPASPAMPAMPAANAPGGFSGAGRRVQGGAEVVPRNKTCKQMTQSLPHYFQPQLAQDTDAVFQLFVSGEEEFSGYLVIKNRENEYYDGQHNSPDITIISSASVWLDVLKGKFTAQKAFMTGQLKVRGNFMLLNRFDQLYKVM